MRLDGEKFRVSCMLGVHELPTRLPNTTLDWLVLTYTHGHVRYFDNYHTAALLTPDPCEAVCAPEVMREAE